MAGKIGEMRKMILYKTKFIKAQNKGYDVAIWSTEMIGGTNRVGKGILNGISDMKAMRTNKNKQMILNNLYIEYSMLTKKFLYESLKNHYNMD